MEKKAIALEGEAQHTLIVNEAIRRGMSTRDVSEEHGKLATVLSIDNKEELILQGIPASWQNERATRICDEKQLTKELFQRLNIPSLVSFVFADPSELKPLDLFDGQKEYVCKPTVGTNGIGVTLNINSSADVYAYFHSNKQLCETFLIEEMHPGYDLRIQVIGGKVVAACKRLPAHVVGNGRRTLQELIDARRQVIKSQNPANKLDIDAQSSQLMDEQGMQLGAVVPDGKTVWLKTISNMGQGGHAIDVTDELDDAFTLWVEQIAADLNTGYFALDVMCLNHQDAQAGHAVALELNCRAEWLHHTFSERRVHDLASVVIDAL